VTSFLDYPLPGLGQSSTGLGGQGFCDDITKAFLLKSVMIEEGCKKMSNIA